MKTFTHFRVGITAFAASLAIGFTCFANEQMQQFANGDPLNWQNGNLNAINSFYVEGACVPFRYEIVGIPENAAIQFEIHYDFTKAGFHAFDFLTGYDLTEAALLAANGGLFADSPLSTLTTNQIKAQALAIPDDALIATDDFLRTSTGTQYFAICGSYTNAYVLTPPAFGGSSDDSGDTEKFLTIRIQGITGGQIAIAWGGHLAVGGVGNWPEGNGAGSISGAPFHQNGAGFVEGTSIAFSTANRSMTAGTVVPSSDLELTKTANVGEAYVGGTIQYTVIVTNNGPSDTTGVTVSDRLPAGLVFVSSSAGAAYAPLTGIWTIGDLPAYSNAQLVITAQVASYGVITNCAQISASSSEDPDSTPGNNFIGTPPVVRLPLEDDEGCAVVKAAPVADLSLSKTASRAFILLGSNFVYTLTVTNAGPTVANGVTVKDVLPPSVQYVSGGAGVYDVGTGIWTVGTLSAGSGATLALTVKALSSGVITNAAEVWTADQFDPDSTPGNGVVTEDDFGAVLVSSVSPGITVIKTAGAATDGTALVVLTGAEVVYTYRVENTGNTYLMNVTVDDDQLGPVGTIPGVLAPGAVTSLTATLSSTLVDVTNIATAAGAPCFENGQAIPGILAVSDTDDAVVDVVAPAIRVVKTAGTAADGAVLEVRPLTDVTYAFEVSNTGDTYLENIVVTDNVLGVVGVIAGPVAPGWTTTLFLVHSNVAADVVNVATARGTPVIGGGQAVEDTDDAAVRVVYFTLTKEDLPDPVEAGQALTYTIWVANPSAHSVLDVVVTESYPPGFIFLSSAPAPSVGNNEWSLGTLEPGELIPIVISGRVATNAVAGQSLHNIVAVDSANAGSQTDEELTRVIGKLTPGKTLIRVTKRDDRDPVGPGEALGYTIRVENFGPGVASNVVVTEAYDPLYSVTNAVPAADAGFDNVWSLGNLAANAFVEIVVSGQVSASAPNGYVVVDTVTASAANAPPSSDEEITLVGTAPPPDIIKTADKNPVQPPEVLTYTLTISNTSLENVVYDVSVVESYDPFFLFVDSTPAPQAGSDNVWYLGDLPPGYVTNIVIRGTVSMKALASDVLFNTAEVISKSGSKTVHLTTRVINVPPIPVELLYFKAVNVVGGVKLKWATATEFENQGYNLYRAESRTGKRTRLNAKLIPGANSLDGQTYKFMDTTAKSGVTYFYWLEEVAWDYATETYGPAVRPASATVKPQAGTVAVLGWFRTLETGGLYRIGYEALAAAGLPLNADRLAVRVRGVAAPVFVNAEGAMLKPGDSLLFYAPRSEEGLFCQVVAEDSPARMELADARPLRRAGAVMVKSAGADQRIRFKTDPSVVRTMLTDFTGAPVWVVDCTDPLNPILLTGYSYVELDNGLTAVYLSYDPPNGPAKCLAVQDDAILEVSRIRR